MLPLVPIPRFTVPMVCVGCAEQWSAATNVRDTLIDRQPAANAADRPGAAGWWVAWGLHLGRAGPAARGTLAPDRGYFGYFGRRHECRCDGRWPRQGRQRGRA